MVMATTILLVDDHPLFRKGLRLLLDSQRGRQIEGATSHGRAPFWAREIPVVGEYLACCAVPVMIGTLGLILGEGAWVILFSAAQVVLGLGLMVVVLLTARRHPK